MSSLMNTDEIPLCTMCQKPKAGHESMRHPFSDPDNPIRPSQVFRKRQKGAPVQPDRTSSDDLVREQLSGLPYDPILRLVLYNKGIISQDDIQAAEQEISKASNLLLGVYGNESDSDGS